MTTDAWTSTDLSIWEGAFQRLRGRFQDAEQRKLLVNALLVEGGEAGDCPPFSLKPLDRIPWLFGHWEDYGDPRRWFYQTAGTEADALELKHIADEAGRALLNSPPWVLLDIGAESRRALAALNPPPAILDAAPFCLPESDALTWVFAVFALAWHGYRGTPLHATPRKVWFANAQADLDGFGILRTRPCRGPLAELVANTPDPPTRWYSRLADLAAASVLACDILLALGRSGLPTATPSTADRPTPPGTPKPLRLVGNMETQEAVRHLRESLRNALQLFETHPGAFGGIHKPLSGKLVTRSGRDKTEKTYSVDDITKDIGAAGAQFGLDPTPLVRLAVEGLPEGQETAPIQAAMRWLDEFEVRLAVADLVPPAGTSTPPITWGVRGAAVDSPHRTPPAGTSTPSNATPGTGQDEGAGADPRGNGPPAPGGAGRKPPGDGPNRYAALETLQPKEYKAWLSFEYAETKAGRRLQDRDAWDWLTENGTDSTGSGELANYELPAFDTWARYLRIARNAVGEQKHRRRTPPTPGRSVVRGDKLDRQKPDNE